MAQGEYPAIMQQDLDQIVPGIPGNHRVVWTFPPVPQALAWTGSISVTPTVQDLAQVGGAAPANPTIAAGDFPLWQSAEWVLLRNGIPLLYWQGLNTVYNVRATSQDVIQLIAMFPQFQPQLTYQARWSGQSLPADSSPFVWPYVAGPANGPTQVFTGLQGPGNNNAAIPDALLTYTYPTQPLVAESDNRFLAPVTTGSVTFLPAGGGTFGYFLYELTLNVSIACLSTVTGVQTWRVAVTTLTAPQTIFPINIDCVPGATNQADLHLPLRGFQLAQGDGLHVLWDNSGASACAYSLSCVYALANGQPA